jgi:hypothetical protein
MKFKNKLALVVGSLSVLAAPVFTADNAGGKSDLSATARESYQIRNRKFDDLRRLKAPMALTARASCCIRRTMEMHDMETAPGG